MRVFSENLGAGGQCEASLLPETVETTIAEGKGFDIALILADLEHEDHGFCRIEAASISHNMINDAFAFDG